jgi:TetR/AcrR family transcriptional regulator
MSEHETREKILKTAAHLFGEYGKNGVSTMDIARAAHVNKALIFYYFGSKDELYRSVFKNLLSGFAETIRNNMLVSEPGLPAIETFMKSHISILRENQNMIRLIIRELLFSKEHEPSILLKDAAEILISLRTELMYALSSARNSGQIRLVDPMQTIVSILSLDVFFFLSKPLAKMVNPNINEDKFEENRIDHVLDLLMNGLRKHQE